MKHMLSLVFILTLFLNCTSCKDPIEPVINTLSYDTTTNVRSIQESGSYYTFYKPLSGYVGDPMTYYNEADKTYYVYFLQDWRNGAPTDHPIYCTTTKDFGSFQGFFEAIPTGESTSQEQFLGTGSFIKDKSGKLFGFYTGHNGSLYPAEKVMLATSTDMRTFAKQPNFTLVAPDGFDKNNWRDPKVYWDPTRSAYVMLITTIKDGKGTLARYTSNDLYTWNQISSLTEFESDAQILECPDIFQMGDKWYLVFSRINRDEHRKTFYRVSDSPDGPWRRCENSIDHHETFDGLYLYAAKTDSDGKNRFISGWCSTGQEVNGLNELDWAGTLITHKLVQQADGRLYPAIPEAVDNKFTKRIPYGVLRTEGDFNGDTVDYTIIAHDKRSYGMFNRNTSSVKIEMDINAINSSKFGFSFGAGGDMAEIYSVTFDLTTNNRWALPAIFLNRESHYATGDYTKELNFTPLIVPNDKQFHVKMILEKSICVVYVNDNVAFTNRIYKMNQNPWTIFADEGKLEISGLQIYKIP